MKIEGEYTTAEVKLPESEVEDSLQQEIQEQTDNKAFQNRVVYMPDCHGGLGPQAIVGFSMPFDDRVVPNTVGGDIGCGMTAGKFSETSRLSDVLHEDDAADKINAEVRRNVPMGTGRVRSKSEWDMGWFFPWGQANETLLQLLDEFGMRHKFEDYRFNMDYFDELCRRVGISKDYAEKSLGSLGGGNHFIELSMGSNTGEWWVVVHSGSRKLGQQIASYWQEKASNYRDKDVKWDQMTPEERYYAMSDGTPNWEKIRRAFDGEDIARVGEGIADKNPDDNRNRDLDYLEGAEMFGYLRDMVFAQTYATFNRRLMVQAVASALDVEVRDIINSPHNYVDFEDGTIRKGSTRAAYDEQFVIPMNMKDGTFLCRGKGNDDWNQSAPHGAGRLGGRRWAKREFDAREVRKEMEDLGIYSAHIPGDEVPQAYKPVGLIERQIQPTAEIVDRLRPVMNFKGN